MDIGEGEPLFGNFEYEALQASATKCKKMAQLIDIFETYGDCQWELFVVSGLYAKKAATTLIYLVRAATSLWLVG